MPKIDPQIGVLDTFRTQKSEIHFALGEFIDNSIDSYFKNKEELKKIDPDFKPYIDIDLDEHNNQIIVEDNCAGIANEDEDRAFSIGKANPNQSDIGTYGMGMKVSAFWFCPKWKVITKSIKENKEKTFLLDLPKIKQIGKTEDSFKKSDSEPYTKIILSEVYRGKFPNSASKKKHLKNYLYDIYRFMIEDKEITIKMNGVPVTQDIDWKIFEKRYINDKGGSEKTWITKIPRIELGSVPREGAKGGKVKLFIKSGAAYLKDPGSAKGQKGFSIYWKNRLVDGHELKPWMPSTSNYPDDKDLQIYQARNHEVARRLEGFIHVCDDYQVPSTKDGLEWEGTEEVLIRKLKKYLENASLVKDDQKNAKYDFLVQCKSISKFKDEDNDREIQESDDEVESGLDDEIEILPIDQDDQKDKKEEKDKSENDIFNDGKSVFNLTYDEVLWKVSTRIIRSNNDKFYSIIEGPYGKSGDKERQIGIKVNLGHPFARYHFNDGFSNSEKEGVIKFCLSLALAESIALDMPGNNPKNIRRVFLSILDGLSGDY